jgi:Tryptophan dimethylallyltransferase
MTDDHTPIEMSWSWAETEMLPTVRYSIEPLVQKAPTQEAAANLHSGDGLNDVRLAQASSGTIDVELSR